jgi:DNA ligase-1
MLAASTDGEGLSYPLLASPKLDGIRCLVVGNVAFSRNLKPVPNRFAQRLFGRREFHGLDGELVVGLDTAPDAFQRSSSGIMSRDGEPDAVFHVFDDWSCALGFEGRLAAVKKRVHGFANLRFVRHRLVRDEEQLLRLEEEFVGDGYEGIMLRKPDGPYKQGRSTLNEGWLMKLKRFSDGEAEVVGYTQLLHNANEATVGELGQTKRSSHKAGKVAQEMLGALTVRDLTTDVVFEVGTGFTEDMRRLLWVGRLKLQGRLVKYKYQPTGVKEKPRFPVFLGFRDPADL